eukprot:gene15547-20606_t
MGDSNENIPLHRVQTKSSEALQILQALLDAAPQTAWTKNRLTDLPLHSFLRRCVHKNSSLVAPEMVSILLAAYPDAVDIRGCERCLPIHIAAASASVQVLQMIAEENMANLSALTGDGNGYSVAHLAVRNVNLENLRYIHSVKPELLLVRDQSGEVAMSQLVAFQSPGDRLYDDLSYPMSVRSEILRFLLRHSQSITHANIAAETAVNAEDDPFGYTSLYENLSYAEVEFGINLEYPRRLLLLAGDPSLCMPKVLKELNYS